MAFILSEEIVFDAYGNVKTDCIKYCINKHKKGLIRLKKLKNYYDGKHIINERTKSQDSANNKVTVNHAEYITDFATSYFIGNPIMYKLDNGNIEAMLKNTNIAMVDQELSREISIYGIGYELIYQNSEAVTKSTNISPENCFLVVNDSVEYKSLFGVHYFEQFDLEGKSTGYLVNVYTDNQKKVYLLKDNELVEKTDKQEEIVFGMVPLIEYWNKTNQKGDFESVISLIDAYNTLQSDRVNDKENFINALLVIYGSLMGDNLKEKVETVKALKKLGLIEMPEGTRAEYISKTFHENEVEVLKQAIVNDIHKISKVPNLTDENFAQNSSGVAMKYKLLGLEQLAQTKEGYYRMGVIERLNIYAAIARIKMQDTVINTDNIIFKRSLPANELEISQLVNNLKGTVSNETLLTQIPFVENVDNELELVAKQKENDIKSQQALFGGYEVTDEQQE